MDYQPGICQEEMAEIVRRFTIEDIIEREIAAGQPFGPMHRQWQLERAPEHIRRMLELSRAKPEFVMTKQGFMGMDTTDGSPSSFTAIATTVTESCLWNTGVTTALQTRWAPIPAGDMRAGKLYKVSFGGVLGTTTGSNTAIWTPRCGPNSTAANAANLSMGASAVGTLAASLSSIPIYGEFTMNVRSLGIATAGATIAGSGFVQGGSLYSTAANTTNGLGFTAVMGGTIPTTSDDSVLNGILVNLTWGTSNAANTCTCTWVAIQSLN